MNFGQDNNKKIYTISQLNSEIRELLETNFPLIWVEGEISNLAQPSSGHIYFSLKDKNSQVKCAMFKRQNNFLNFLPENGMHVLAASQVSLYEQRGDYQLIVQHMAQAGDGILQRKFEELKKRLQTEGLFDSTHKKSIPRFPTKVGVVTSSTGAALRDIISVLRRRFANIPVIIYPSQVQGLDAKNQLVNAIKTANEHNKSDVLIIARGGGPLEDLWPFNEEIVARAIFNSRIPIVSGIGHETDFTIADFVADVRAATPSAAAELVSPNSAKLLSEIDNLEAKLFHMTKTNLKHCSLILENLKKRLQHPGKKLRDYAQQLDINEQRLSVSMRNILKHKKNDLMNLSKTLETISPLATLNRGFSIAMTENRKIISSIDEIEINNNIEVLFKKGSASCKIISKHTKNKLK